MRTVSLIAAGLVAALAGVWLFEQLHYRLTQYDWLGSGNITDTPHLSDVRQLYVFAYLAVFALVLAFRWPVSVKRLAVSSILVLIGGILPVMALLVRWYATSHLSVADILERDKMVFPSLLAAHGMALVVVNGLFYFVNMNRPTRSSTGHLTPGAHETTARTTH
jgi:hypothetical protein